MPTSMRYQIPASPKRIRTDDVPNVIQWDMGVAMTSVYDADGFLGVQYDAEGENNSGVQPYEVHPVNGVLHRPKDPQVDASGNPVLGATVMFGMEGGRGHIIPLGDPRTIGPLLALIQKGETLLFSDFGQFVRLTADGAIAMYTTDSGGDPSGTGITWRFGTTSLDYEAPWGREQFDANGWRVRHAGGGTITLGYATGVLPGKGSYFRVSADLLELDGAISVGPTGVPQMPVVKLTPLVTLLGQILSTCQAIELALAGFTGSGSFPGLPAVVTQIASLTSQVASATETLATQTTMG